MSQSVREILQTIKESKDSLEFMSTGFSELDEALDGGFMKKELVVLGGRTGIGKSYIAGQIMYSIALQAFKTAYFSLEISNGMVLSRLIGALADVKSTHILTGKVFPQLQDGVRDAEDKLTSIENVLSFHDDLYEYDEIEKEIRQKQYEFVVIDFIQNVMVKGLDEYTRLSQVALSLQKLAKETNCCILLLSQLSNSVSRSGSEVIEYKGSGSIATVCDLGFFIEREHFEFSPDVLTLNLRKNRRGISGTKFEYEMKKKGGWIYERAQDQAVVGTVPQAR